MARQSKKKSLLDDPATAALMKELGMGKQEAPPPVKKVVRKRRGKPTKTPNIKSEVEKKKKGYATAVSRKWKVLYGTNKLEAGNVAGWLRGYGSTMIGDPPELRGEMLVLSNLARFIATEMDKDK
jgi:hypothetical protein